MADGPNEHSEPSKKAVFERAANQFGHDNLTTPAAALTYYAVLSWVPGLIVSLSVLGLANRSDLTGPVPRPGIERLVRALFDQPRSAPQERSCVSAIVGIVIALWSASSYLNANRQASNIIHGIGEGRPIWKTVLRRLGVALVAVIVLVVSAGSVVVNGPVVDQVGNLVGTGHGAVVAWDIAKWVVLLMLISILLAVLFWPSPNAQRGQHSMDQPGGVIATMLWLATSALFAVYVTNLSYEKTYESLAGIVIFLVWLWLTNVAILLGGEVNAEFDHARAIAQGSARRRASFRRTTGHPQAGRGRPACYRTTSRGLLISR